MVKKDNYKKDSVKKCYKLGKPFTQFTAVLDYWSSTALINFSALASVFATSDGCI